jgi:HK97 family phage major capsid protein
MCLATSSPEYMRAWVKVMRGRQSAMTPEEQAALTRAMSLTDASGGVLVPFQLDPTVIITSAGSRNDIRQIARQVVATGDVWNGVSSGAASWSWDAEGQQVGDDTTTFVQPSIPNYKGAGFIPISIEALQDEANVTGEVARILAFGKDTLEAAAFATGTGVGQPTGLITALVASSPSVIQTSTTTDTFAVADIYKVDGALPARYRRNASWLANRKTYNLVRQFDSAGGAALWERIGADVPPQLVGRGAFESEDMDGTITAGAENYMMAYGDGDSFVITDRIGFSVEPIPHLFGSNGRPTGSRGWYAYYRTGSDVVNDSAWVLLNVT